MEYRGYLIEQDKENGLFYVTLDNLYLESSDSLDGAKRKVDRFFLFPDLPYYWKARRINPKLNGEE